MRFGGVAAAALDRRGIMASRNGRASETPEPCRKARREMAGRVIMMGWMGVEKAGTGEIVSETYDSIIGRTSRSP